MIKRHWFKALVVISFITIWFWKGCEVTHKDPIKPEPTRIDTVPGNFEVPEVKPNVAPKEKKVFKKKDRALRDSAESKDIILDVKIEDGHIIEDVIDTSGQVTEIVLDVPVVLVEYPNGDTPKEIVIVPEGVEVKEKTKAGKFLQKVGKGVKKAGKVVVITLAGIGVVAILIVAGGG